MFLQRFFGKLVRRNEFIALISVSAVYIVYQKFGKARCGKEQTRIAGCVVIIYRRFRKATVVVDVVMPSSGYVRFVSHTGVGENVISGEISVNRLAVTVFGGRFERRRICYY